LNIFVYGTIQEFKIVLNGTYSVAVKVTIAAMLESAMIGI